MLSSNTEQTTMDFPMGTAKPGHYSDKEIPKLTQVTKQQPHNSNVKTESHLEKIYQVTTSLPVSSALLAAVTSQGVPVGGSLWYINYSAILVILLTAVAVLLSYLSTTASHSYCETIFLTIYTPASQLFSVTLNLQDVHPVEQPATDQSTRRVSPTWLKQLLFTCIALAATQGLTLIAIVYAVCMTLIYSGLSNQLKKYVNIDTTSAKKIQPVISLQAYICIIFMMLSIAVDIFIFQFAAVLNVVYFVLTDQVTVAAIKKIVESQNIEIMEGLEQYYAQGLVHLAEIVLALLSVIVQPSLCLLYIPVFYFCVFEPFVLFRVLAKTIQTESLCLSHFEKATGSDISSYDDVCAICLCTMKHARVTPCKHMFHGKCLKDCLQKKAQCPMCNTQLL